MISASSRNRPPADRIVGVFVEKLLEGDLAVQFAVHGDEDRIADPPWACGRSMRNRRPSPVAVPTA